MPRPIDYAESGLPDADRWAPWTPHEVARRFAAVEGLWHVAGGWALDVWRGRVTRPHSDLEIAILRSEFPVFRSKLPGFRLCVAGSGKVHPLNENTEPPSDIHQVWVLDDRIQCWRLDIFLEPGDADTWVFRRDPTIRRARGQMIGKSDDGLTYLKPEGVLLFKAKACRPKDEEDFSACIDYLQPEARCWLRNALRQTHPGHRWLQALAPDAACMTTEEG